MKTINSLCSKLLALTLALMASVSTFAYEFEYVNDFHVDGFAYKVLPPTMEAPFGNVALIEIADCTEDVVIPGTVTHEGVTYIVTTLGGGATLFTNSAKEIVKSVFIPKKISTINSPLFADCSNLTSIVVDSRNSYYDSRENCNAIITTSQNSFFTPNMLIAGCKTTTIPNSVTEIADKAFYRSAIESITIPTGVTKIGHSAFNQATLLSSIKLPITLTEIGDWAFADCLSLNTISCYALEPPTISSNTFFGSHPIYNNPSVYVPAYCIEAYKNAEHWKWFTQILPINEPAYKDRWCDTWNVLTIKRELETWQYNLAHDTIIGDYTYTAVTRHTTKVPAGVYPVMAPEPEYVAAVRFTEDKKAFIYYDNTEYLLYDFNAQPGDELTVFAGINHYRSHKTNRCGIGEVNIFPDSNYYYSREISLNVYPNYTGSIVPTCFGITKWIEGVGDICGLITGADCGLSDDQSALLCAYKDGNTEYTTEEEEYAEYGCEYNSGENKEYILTLPGLQRTEVELSTIEGYVDPYHLSFKEYTPTLVNGKLYLCDGRNYFREENNQVLLYAPYLGMEEDLVLYDWTLEVGDTLPYKPKRYTDEQLGMLFRVTDVSTIQLLDGKEYKKWTFSGGYEFVEGIGAINKGFGHFNCLRHTIHTGMSAGERLVCASRNGQLLIDNTEKWGVECQCEIETSYKSQWCNQWNILSHGYQGPQDPLAAAHTSIFWLSNNTVNRDGHEYIPLMCSSSMPEVESTTLIGELRFTEDKQVYFNYDNTEYLLYDFDVQVGDTLDIFGGIELYSYSFVEQKTYPHVITKIDTLDDGRLQITSDAIVIFEDSYGAFEEKMPQTWIEGLGSTNGIVYTSINPGIAGDAAIVMLCAYRDDECVYKTDSNDPYWIDYTQLGCVYNEGDFIEGAFPILSGLQRTVYDEFCGEAEIGAVYTGKQTFDKIFFENDKPYILCNDYLLREEDNKILIYSQLLNKDLVLYDFTLEVGDSLPALYIDYHARNAMDWMPYNPDVVDYNIDFDGTIYPADTFVVTDISNVTLLDGKEYKKWTFDNGMEYVEGIGMYGGRRNGDFFGLIQEVVVPCHIGTHLVCVSKNGKLLYQMDDEEMERLGAECLCDYDRGPRKDNAKDGQIGGRPTPTQWNMLEMELRKMENGISILQAETFSYTLEDISQQVNSRTYFQLARQSTKDTATTKSVVGALHFGKEEDNRVYFLRDGVEYVLYDFTAEIGDTVEIFAGINNYPQETTYTHVVVDKDTTEDGACRMFLEVVFPEETTTATNAEKVWLAGLGSIDGIVHNAASRASKARSSETQTSVMLCAWREDNCLYTTDHPDYDTYGCVYNQDPTALESPTSPSSYQKILREGQLLIMHNGKIYTIMGIEIK